MQWSASYKWHMHGDNKVRSCGAKNIIEATTYAEAMAEIFGERLDHGEKNRMLFTDIKIQPIGRLKVENV